MDNARLEKLKKMGIPAPLPVDPSLIMPQRNQNSEKAKLLQEIQSGKLRSELETYKNAADNAIPIGSTQLKPPSKPVQQTPPKKESQPIKPKSEFADIENVLLGGNSTKPKNTKSDILNEYDSKVQDDSHYGDIMKKLAERRGEVIPDNNTNTPSQQRMPNGGYGFSDNQIVEPHPMHHYQHTNHNNRLQPNNNNIINEGKTFLNEEDVKNQITEISTRVAKDICEKMLKNFLNEAMKNGLHVFQESKTLKKAEVVGTNTVMINGKKYKLTPVA